MMHIHTHTYIHTHTLAQTHVEDRGNRFTAEILTRDYGLLRAQRQLVKVQAQYESSQGTYVCTYVCMYV
jgi:hypothetical protein